MRVVKSLSIAAVALVAAACSGGGGSSLLPKNISPVSPSQPTGSAPQSTQKTTVRIHIPAPTAKSSSSRHRAFVSAATSYVLVTETDSTFTNELTQVETDVTPTSAACTSDNNGMAGSMGSPIVGSRTCTVQIDATPTSGTSVDSFEFDTYSSSQTVAMPNTLLQSDGMGDPYAIPAGALDSARVQQPIMLDTSNTISVTLDGEVASFMVVPSIVSGDGSQVINAQFAITAFDSSGEAIIAGANDPYTDGTNYPLTFSFSEDRDFSPSNTSTGTYQFLTLTPGGPDFTGSNAGTTPFAQSADYLSAMYNPYSGITYFQDFIIFTTPESSPLNNDANQSGPKLIPAGFVAPIFIDPGTLGPTSGAPNPSQPGSSTGTGSTNGSGPVFLQNDTNAPPGTAPIQQLRHRTVAQRSFAGSRRRETGTLNTTGNNYPIVSFTAVGQTQTVTPVGGAGFFTYTLSTGCYPNYSTTNGENGPTTVTVSQATPTYSYSRNPSFVITATSTTLMNTTGSTTFPYTATDAFGQAITACSITFTDKLGNSALLEVTNTNTTSTPIDIDPGTLVTSSSSGNIALYDTSTSAFSQIVSFPFSDTNQDLPTGVAIDPAHDVFVGAGNSVYEYPFSGGAYAATPALNCPTQQQGGVPTASFCADGNTAVTALAYHALSSTTGEIAFGDAENGRVYVDPFPSDPTNPQHPWIGPTINNASITGVAIDPRGNIFAADHGNAMIDEYYVSTVPSYSKVKPDRTIKLASGSVSGVAVDGSDNVFISDPNNGDIYEFTPRNQTGTPDLTIDPDSMNQPACTGLISIAVTTTGGGETVYASCGVGNPGAVYSYSLSSGTGVYEPVNGVMSVTNLSF